MALCGYGRSNMLLKQPKSNCYGVTLLNRLTICSFSHLFAYVQLNVEVTNGCFKTSQCILGKNDMKEKKDYFYQKARLYMQVHWGGGELHKKCLNIFAKNFFNQSFYVYEFPNGNNESSLCSICFKAILRKIEQKYAIRKNFCASPQGMSTLTI